MLWSTDPDFKKMGKKMIDSFKIEIKLLAVTDGSYNKTKLSGLYQQCVWQNRKYRATMLSLRTKLFKDWVRVAHLELILILHGSVIPFVQLCDCYLISH